MKDVIALVLAGGRISGFDVLTQNRAKAALPICGTYRLIDFCLSNLSNSEIEKVGLIIQYLPASMIEHVGIGKPWDFHGYGRILKIMPPFVGMGQIEWFKGTSDALYKNLNFIYENNPRDILVVCGDHLYQMDFKPIIEFHRANDADLTVVGKKGAPRELSRKFGYFEVNDKKRITKFIEKPTDPFSDMYSVGIHVFKTEALLNWLSENQSLPEESKTNVLAFDIIQKRIPTSRSFGYEWDGYWNYIEDKNVYFLAHLEALSREQKLNVSEWNISTNIEDRHLSDRVPFFAGANSQIKRSMISPGCSIDGTVEWSVLSPGVVVEEGAYVSHSIIFHDCVIKKGAKLNRVISDKDCVFSEGCEIGEADDTIPAVEYEEFENGKPASFRIIPDQKLTVIGKNVTIGKEIKMRHGCVVSPNTDLTLMYGKIFGAGEKISRKGVE